MESGIFPIVRDVPSWTVLFDSERAARFYGEAYRRQIQYFWSEAEAIDFAWLNFLGEGPGEVVAA